MAMGAWGGAEAECYSGISPHHHRTSQRVIVEQLGPTDQLVTGSVFSGGDFDRYADLLGNRRPNVDVLTRSVDLVEKIDPSGLG
jgi:hypothetical protein